VSAGAVSSSGADVALGDIFHVQRDADYERMVREEAAFWDQPQAFGVDIVTPEIAPYQNRRLTGDPSLPWHEMIARYGRFTRGLALGASGLKLEAAILRSNPSLHLTFCDISEKSLAARDEVLGPQFPGRVATRAMDLNFAELEAESYDLIVSSSSLHHIANLEHVAYQANRALTAGGYMFVQDYVGESHFEFSAEKRRVFEAVLAEEQARYPEARGWHIEWPRREDFSPFEAVRSAETLDVLRAYLHEERLATAGALLTMLLILRVDEPERSPVRRPSVVDRLRARLGRRAPSRWVGDRTAFLQATAGDLVMLDEILCDAGVLLPSNAFAIYRKRP
jgi:SAM-dependent methyltransferase